MTESTNPCRSFFEEHTANTKKVELLQKNGFGYDWENHSASKYSPGPVESDEQVVRLIINPIHIDTETGELKPSAITDVKDKGCSVDRIKIASPEKSIASGQSIAQAKNLANPDAPSRKVHCVAYLSAGDIRSITVGDNIRAFCIFDTALEDNLAHADVCQVISPKGQEARSARGQLFTLAEKGLNSFQ